MKAMLRQWISRCAARRAPVLLVLGLLLSKTAFALMPSTPVPGGVAVLSLPPQARQAHYEDRPVWLIRQDDQLLALVGLALTTTPGPHRLDWRDEHGQVQSLRFTVEDKAYPTQKLTVPPKMVDLDPATAERVRGEQARIRRALTQYRPVETTFPWPLALPATGPTSSPFGLRRVFNGQSRNPHSGLDIAASEGEPVHAAAPGIVVETGDFYFNGNSVFVDHGGGLISMYCHLSRIAVQVGERIADGQLLGQVGHTGRATGPHLHWGVALNGNLVDPQLFLQPRPSSSKN
ncbi:MAG: peptidoglycan DD-metalloendopeptidase family protein [Candidatus Macondimonas sp.]